MIRIITEATLLEPNDEFDVILKKGLAAVTEKNRLTGQERAILLDIARQAIRTVVNGLEMPAIVLPDLPPALGENGASFVTLTIASQLRGCIGTLEAYQPLALDVQEHAVAAAAQDYRFPPVSPQEEPLLEIEISRLTPTQLLEYNDWQDLLVKLRPGIDGVLLRDGTRRATFLPQVWEKVPQPEEFLTHLCYKMGASGDCWREKKLDVFTYQVEEFKET
jgi:AmmeMemoRadiSam system protein A